MIVVEKEGIFWKGGGLWEGRIWLLKRRVYYSGICI